MSTYSQYKNPLDRATKEMQRLMALPENIVKPSWLTSDPALLFDALKLHVERLADAIEQNRSAVARVEAANVANFAWMLVERKASESKPELYDKQDG